MTTAIYARFSSDMQDARSIDDQVAACTAFAQRSGLIGPFFIYADHALSGASMAQRAHLQKLLVDVRARRIKVVVSEALDRLSRDQADVALIHRAVKLASGKILTISEGEVDALHIGLKGTMNHIFLEELARKTRRGLIGVARSGRIAGGLCYGYRAVEGRRGEREIDEAQAAIVRSIYEQWVQNRSPLRIAKALNDAGISAPRGGVWRVSTLLGDPRRHDGILSQELYRGRILFNRRRFIKDPETGRRRSELNPPSEWIIVEAPALRIVEEKLWLAAQARRRTLAEKKRPEQRRRPKRLLSGLVRCGACGGAVTIVGEGQYGCANARQVGACAQRRSLSARKLDARVLSGLKRHLLAPELIGEAVRAYHEELAKLRREENRRRAELERDLGEARRRADRIAEQLIAAASAILRTKLQEAETQIAKLETDLAAFAEPAPIVEMHPNAANLYRARITDLEAALTRPEGEGTLNSVRALIERVEMTPDVAAPAGWRVTIHGQLAAILSLSEADPAAKRALAAATSGAGTRTAHWYEPEFRFAA